MSKPYPSNVSVIDATNVVVVVSRDRIVDNNVGNNDVNDVM